MGASKIEHGTSKESYSVAAFLADGRIERIYTSFVLLCSGVENAITKPRCQRGRWMFLSLRDCNHHL
jgi:hypothetical protein